MPKGNSVVVSTVQNYVTGLDQGVDLQTVAVSLVDSGMFLWCQFGVQAEVFVILEKLEFRLETLKFCFQVAKNV